MQTSAMPERQRIGKRGFDVVVTFNARTVDKCHMMQHDENNQCRAYVVDVEETASPLFFRSDCSCSFRPIAFQFESSC